MFTIAAAKRKKTEKTYRAHGENIEALKKSRSHHEPGSQKHNLYSKEIDNHTIERDRILSLNRNKYPFFHEDGNNGKKNSSSNKVPKGQIPIEAAFARQKIEADKENQGPRN